METAAPGASRPTLAAVGIQSTTSRLLFVDNIRVLLTILVLLFHLMITYAGTGDWWYMEGREDTITGVIGAWFIVVNQAYFMGLFLLISAYFAGLLRSQGDRSLSERSPDPPGDSAGAL